MFSSKPRLVVPYGLKTLLEGVSRAVLKTNPPNITQFAAVYFKELIVFREGNSSLDIKDLVKQFHQIKVEKWSEGPTQEKTPECARAAGPSIVPQEPTRMEKSTTTEEDNVIVPHFSNKTTQFPSVHAELEETTQAARGPSKPSTPEIATPPSSPHPAAVSPEFAYVPADPAQFAAQMLGKVSSIHSDRSDVLMVDVATSMPVVLNEVPSSENGMAAASIVCSGEGVAVQGESHTSVRVDLGSKRKDSKAEPSTASSLPLQDEQEPPACDQAPVQLYWGVQAGTGVTSVVHVSSVYKDEPVIEGVTYVQQTPEQIGSPVTDHVASPKETSPPVSPTPVSKAASGMSENSIGSAKLAHLEDAKHESSIHVEAEATILISDSSLKGLFVQPPDVEGSAKAIGSEKSLHLEVEIIAVVPGQEESPAPQATEVQGVVSGDAAHAAHSGAAVRPSGGSLQPEPEGLTEPELEPDRGAAPEQGLADPAIATSEAGQPPPYSNMWTLYCLTDMNQQSRPSPPPAPGPFPQAALYLPNPKELQNSPKVTPPTYMMMDDSKKTSAPPFILVGSSMQEAQDWSPVPGHAVASQPDTLKRYAAVHVPIAVPADQKFQKHPPNPQHISPPTNGPDGPRPKSPVFFSVAFPVEDVAKKGSGSGDKRTPFGSYGIAGEITVTSANVRRAEP